MKYPELTRIMLTRGYYVLSISYVSDTILNKLLHTILCNLKITLRHRYYYFLFYRKGKSQAEADGI